MKFSFSALRKIVTAKHIFIAGGGVIFLVWLVLVIAMIKASFLCVFGTLCSG